MKQYHNSNLSFIDMLFNVSMIFAVLFIVAIILMSDPTPKEVKKIDEKAKLLIVMTWDDQSSDDIDLWLRTPEPKNIGYNNPNGNIANLTRDDLGTINDSYTENGVLKWIRLNKEVITVRQTMNGHYEVNAYFYARHQDPERKTTSTGPVNVVVQVIQIDPVYKEIVTKSVTLDTSTPEDRQHTVVQFDIDNNQILNLDTNTQDMFITNSKNGSVDSGDEGDDADEGEAP